MTSTSSRLPYLALAGGIICIGFAPIFIKLANTSGDIVAFYRLMLTSLALLVPMFIHWRRGRIKVEPAVRGWIVGGGILFGFNMFTFSTAVQLSTASTATLLANNAPIIVGLGAWLLLKERLRPTYWVGLGVALVGSALVVCADGLAPPSPTALTGNIWALINATGYGVFQLISRHTRQQADNLTYVFSFTTVGALSLLAMIIVRGVPLFDLPLSSYLALGGLAVAHLGGWLLISYAYGHFPASLVSVSLLGQPVTTALVANPILGETPTLRHLLGGLVTLSGIYLVQRGAGQVDEKQR